MKSLRRTFAAFAAVCLTSAAVFAADVSGTWKWAEQGRGRGGSGGGGGGKGGDTPREVTLTLTQKDGKVSGKISRPGRDGQTSTADISDVKVDGDKISFSYERQFGDNKFVTKYSGKISGDTITGESESPGRDGGTPRKSEWTAKRSK